jgi:hypothetical protein
MGKKTCPSSWALERILLDEAGVAADVRAHSESCELCQAELERRRQVGSEFMTSSAARELASKLVGERPPRKVAPLWGLAAMAALAVVGAISLLPRARDPVVSDLTPKGESQLGLWVERSGANVLLTEPVPELQVGDRLQAEVATQRASWLVLLLVDPSGDVVPIVGEGGGAMRVEAGSPGALGPSFRLDDERGRYRLLLFRAEGPFEVEVARRSAVSGERFAGDVELREFVVGP